MEDGRLARERMVERIYALEARVDQLEKKMNFWTTWWTQWKHLLYHLWNCFPHLHPRPGAELAMNVA